MAAFLGASPSREKGWPGWRTFQSQACLGAEMDTGLLLCGFQQVTQRALCPQLCVLKALALSSNRNEWLSEQTHSVGTGGCG